MSKIINLESTRKKYYSDGALKSEFLLIDGCEKLLRMYFEDGSLRAESPVENSQLNGTAFVYYKNGNIHCKIEYLDHQQNGLSQGYYRDGKKAIEVFFNRGRAMFGVYYKKDGIKNIMSQKQLDRKTEER